MGEAAARHPWASSILVALVLLGLLVSALVKSEGEPLRPLSHGYGPAEPTATITLAPQGGTNPAGQPHLVVATALKADGTPNPGQDLVGSKRLCQNPDCSSFGPPSEVQVLTSEADGKATFTFNSSTAGTYVIHVYADNPPLDGIPPAEAEDTPVASAFKTWVGAGGEGQGYWMVASDGGVFTFGDAGFFGSLGGTRLNRPIVDLESHATGLGYWFAASDGGVFAFGSASFLGGMGGTPLNSPVVAMAGTPSGGGYWLVASDGGIFTFGDAGFFGSMGGTRLNSPIVAMAATPTGQGYWMFAADGGVFTFGDAAFLGSRGGTPLNRPIVSGDATADGKGYWMVASDGGVFSFGTAGFFGSTGGIRLAAPVVDFSAEPGDGGYWMAASDGGVFAFEAPFLGSAGGLRLVAPIVALEARGS